MPSILSSFRNAISNLIQGKDDEKFLYFWEDIEKEEEDLTQKRSIKNVLYNNQFILLHLGLALVTFGLLISILIENTAFILISFFLLLGLIFYSYFSTRHFYHRPLHQLDQAISKLNKMDFAIEENLLFYQIPVPALINFENFRVEMANLIKSTKDSFDILSKQTATLDNEYTKLKLVLKRTNDRLGETIGTTLNLQDMKSTLNNISQGTDSFISTFDEALVGIGNISKEFRSIAKQITMLSLNAGIEAAKAGEKGIGFEIVASNLRRLAYHASNSTHIIKEMVKNINSKAKEEIEYVTQIMNDLSFQLDRSHQSMKLILDEFEQSQSNLDSIQVNSRTIEGVVNKQKIEYDKIVL